MPAHPTHLGIPYTPPLKHSNRGVTNSGPQKYLENARAKLREEMNSRCGYTSIPKERPILSTRHVKKPYQKAQSELKLRFDDNGSHTPQ